MNAIPKRNLIEGLDYVIRTVDFQTSKVDGCVVSDPDGCATIIINRRVCPERQRIALIHELEHLMFDDLYSEEPVSEIEKRRL